MYHFILKHVCLNALNVIFLKPTIVPHYQKKASPMNSVLQVSLSVKIFDIKMTSRYTELLGLVVISFL